MTADCIATGCAPIEPQAPPPGRLAAVVNDSLIYLAGAAFIGLGNFILLPLYTRALSTAEFGLYALLDVAILIVVTISQLGLGISYLKWFADVEPERRAELLSSSTMASLGAGIFGGAILLAIVQASAWASPAGRLVPWLVCLIVPMETLQVLLLADLRARRRSVLFCAAAVARLLIMAGASLWFVQVERQGIAGVFMGRAIGGASGVILLGLICKPFRAHCCRLPLMREMLGYGLPLVWSALVGVGMDASGRFLLARQVGLDQVAIYAVALKIAAVMQVCFLQPFGTAWSGVMFQMGRDEGAPATITGILSCAFVAGMTLAAVISIVSPIVLPLFGNTVYRGAAVVIPWLLLPSTFRILEYWSSLGLYTSRHTGWIASIATGGAAVNVAMAALLAPRLGAQGAAIAWNAGLLVAIGGYTVLGRRYYRLPVNWQALALGLLVWAAGAASGTFSPGGYSAAGLAWGSAAILVVVAPAAVWFTRCGPGILRGGAA